MTLSPPHLTLGTSVLGRGTVPGSTSGDTDESDAVDAAERMLRDAEVWVDTSNNYAEGRSEAVIGRALKRIGDAEERRVAASRIVTKVDQDPDTGAFDRDRVMRSFEESCARLGVQSVPLLHLHDPYSLTLTEAMGPGGAVAGLIELREAGAVGAIGIAAEPIDLMTAYVETGAFDAVLNHNHFTLVDRSAAPLFEQARARRMTVFNAAPFGGGILAHGVKPGSTYAYRAASDDLVTWVGRAEDICASHGITLGALALHFSMRSPLVDSTVVGVPTSARLAQLSPLVQTAVPEAAWAEIAELALPRSTNA